MAKKISELPVADALTGTELMPVVQGGVTKQVDRATFITGLGGGSYTLPAATGGTLGGIRVGSQLSIDGSGILSATYTYTLPTASAGTIGGIRVGVGLSIDGSGIVSATNTVVTETGTSRTATPSHASNYTRFTNASAKTYTFDAAQSYVVGTEFHGRNAGTADLTLTAAGGMSLSAPAGGTLVVPNGGTFTVKIVATNVADVIGVTVAA